MKTYIRRFGFFIMMIWFSGCHSENKTANSGDLIPGASRTDAYLPLLEGKRVGLVVNQTSVVDSVHLVDFLL